jgi:hypothetical protein
MFDPEKEFDPTLELALQIIAERHRITENSSPEEAARRVRAFTTEELAVAAKAFRQLSSEALEEILGRPKVFATGIAGLLQAHPGRPGNVLALLVLGEPTPELGLRLPDRAAKALDVSLYSGEKHRIYVCLNGTFGEAPVYRVYPEELSWRVKRRVRSLARGR